MTRAQSLSKHGIGASEIATVAGCNPFESEWGLWLRRTGQAPDIDPTPPIEWGHRLEPAIRQKYADSTGATLYVPPASLFHPETTWARATPDAIVLDDERWSHLVQAKNVGYWVGKEWRDSPPEYVLLQEQWELYVTGLARADVAALIGGSDYRVYTVHRDDGFIADLVTIAEAFLRKVETRTSPAVDESDACRAHFARRLAKADNVELIADENIEALVAKWRRARAGQRAVERRVAKLRNEVSAHLADAQCDRLRSSQGTATIARTLVKTHRETNWRLVAEMLGATDQPRFRELVEANTTTTTTEASASLREPREWSKERT